MTAIEPIPTAKRVAIFVIAYDAVNTLAQTIERIPPEVAERVEEIFVIDDCSQDNTYYAALGYKQARGLDKLKVFRNQVNRRYGGNQKAGYRYAIEQGFDIVVMLHADGQYAPEALPALLAPLLADEADMVFGSRMASGGNPLKGGMPLYKFLGNKVLTWLENHILDMDLSEFHSGYRLYSCAALARLPFLANSDDWHFDTEILIQFKEAGLRIAERPIPTYYGDEICHVNGIGYAFNCLRAALAYRAHKAGWIDVPAFQVSGPPRAAYEHKPDPHSSHGQIMREVERLGGRHVLELGTSTGYLTRRMAALGCLVTGVEHDPLAAQEAAPACRRMVVADLDALDWRLLEGPYDLIVCGDVLEHLKDPWAALDHALERLAPGGHVVVSLPNIAHWLWRLKLLGGGFDYMAKGPLDRTHLRFFTRKTAIALLQQAGLKVTRVGHTPLPLPTLAEVFAQGRALGWVHALGAMLTGLRPTLLAYQFVLVGQKSTTPAIGPPITGELRIPAISPVRHDTPLTAPHG